MQKLFILLGLVAGLSCAQAADNAVIVTPGTGVTLRSKDVGSGVQSLQQILSDTSGNAIYGTAGTANSNVLSVQGIASGTAVPTSAASGAFASGSHASGSFASGAFASGALASGSVASGAMVDLGAQADAAWASGSGSLIAIAKTIANNTGAAIPAGVAIIGYVGGDGTAGTASSHVVTIQGIASMTKLLVTPDANSSVNVAQINGATPLMGNGTTGTGSHRVTIASDNTAFSVNATLGTETTKVIGTARTVGNIGGVLDAVIGAAPPANSQQLAALGGGATAGLLSRVISCDSHVYKHITSATDTVAVQGVASQTIYICGWRSRAAGTATWYLENTASANNNCSSTLTQLTGLASEVVNSGEVFAPGFWTGLKNTSGNGLCINSTGTGGVDVDIWYAQF